MKKRSRFEWIVLALCVLSFVRGIYGLGDQSLWWDESLSHYRATRPFSFILSNRINIKVEDSECPSVDNHPPLYFVLLRVVVLIAGNTEFALRFLSLAAGVLVIPLLYQCGKRLFDPLSGTAASLFGALSPLYLWYQQEARPYSLVTFFGLLSFFVLSHLLAAENRHRLTRARYGTLYVLSVAAMLTTHYLSFLLLAAQGVIWILAWLNDRRRHLFWFLTATALVAVVFFAWGWTALPRQASLPGYEFLPLPTLLRDVFHAFALGLSGDTLIFFRWSSTAVLGLASLVLIIRRQDRRWQHPVWLLLCFLLPVASIFALSYFRPAYLGVRHLIFASPFYYILLGAGLTRLARLRPAIPARVLAGAGLALIAVGMVWSTVAYLTDPQYVNEDHRGWGEHLSRYVRPDELVVVAPAPVLELYTYYVDSAAATIELPLFCRPRSDTTAWLEAAADRYDRIWVAYSSTPGWGDPIVPIRWLEEHATQTHVAQFDSASTVLHVYAYRTRMPLRKLLPAVTWTPSLNFDDQIHLLGMDGPGEPIESGRTLHLSLYWTVPQKPDRDHRIALSLVDRDGFSWASVDHAPCDGVCPTAGWPPTGIIKDDLDLDIPAGVPPGQYQLNVSVYPERRDAPALAAKSLADDRLQGLIVPVGQVQIASPTRPTPTASLTLSSWTRRSYGDIVLLGHDYGGGKHRPGDVFSLGLYWQALRKHSQDASLTLQLADPTGRIWAERHVPVSDAYPTSQWSRDEIVWEQYRFRIPVTVPEGPYELLLEPGAGLTSQRLRFWETDRELLGDLVIEPPATEYSFQIPAMQHASYANLDDKAELLGYDLESSTVRPGEVVSYTLYWRALQEINTNYTIFNHLIAADGQTWGQWDNQPQRGNLPTSRWIPGQVIADPYQVPVAKDAPAGPIQVWIGMYDALTMARLSVRDDSGQITSDHIILDELSVVTK